MDPMEKLIENLKDYKENPGVHAWSELSNRLEHKKHRKNLSHYRRLSIAAMFVAGIACLGVMSLFIKNYNPSKFATSESFSPVIMEPLYSTTDDLYQIENIRSLYADYKKVGAFSE